MEFLLMNVHLSVEIKNDLLMAHLIFENRSARKIYLDQMTLCSKNKVERNVFIITDKEGREVAYTGRILKRTVMPEEFICLDVGGQFATTVALNDVYKIRMGHTYVIQYNTYNPQNLHDDDPLIKMESDKIEIMLR